MAKSTDSHIISTIGSGQKTDRDVMNTSTEPDYFWIEKITYSSSIPHKTYYLAALKTKASSQTWGGAVKSLAEISTEKLTKLAHFFSQLPLFSKMLRIKLQASLIEGYLFYTQLKRIILGIFP